MILGSPLMIAQVGIATTSPTAQLEITNDVTTPDYPLLELNPQTAPVGTATGQLAVIGDLLYMYDATRGKWLTTETIPIQYGRGGDAVAQALRYAGNNASGNSGPLMPFDGTIVMITANSNSGSATSNSSKEFQVRVRNGTSTSSTINFNLTSYVFSQTDYNIDFNAGDFINVRARDLDSSGDTVNNPAVMVWVKWRR